MRFDKILLTFVVIGPNAYNIVQLQPIINILFLRTSIFTLSHHMVENELPTHLCRNTINIEKIWTQIRLC